MRETEGLQNSRLLELDSNASFAIIHLWLGDLNLLSLSLPHQEPDTRLDNL